MSFNFQCTFKHCFSFFVLFDQNITESIARNLLDFLGEHLRWNECNSESWNSYVLHGSKNFGLDFFHILITCLFLVHLVHFRSFQFVSNLNTTCYPFFICWLGRGLDFSRNLLWHFWLSFLLFYIGFFNKTSLFINYFCFMIFLDFLFLLVTLVRILVNLLKFLFEIVFDKICISTHQGCFEEDFLNVFTIFCDIWKHLDVNISLKWIMICVFHMR